MEDTRAYDYIENTIIAISQQIELLSNKCKLEENKKNVNFEKILEVSSLMLQLSRTLNELIVTKNFLENSNSNPVDVLNSIVGRMKK